MFSIHYGVYLFIIATTLAILEIQIESKAGWAKNLPCWRPDPQSLVSRVYGFFMEGKELTGYHLAIFALVLVVVHFPFAAGVDWSLREEIEAISAYLLLGIFWDYLWFVWNPHYGIKQFSPQYVGWHQKWIGPLPRGYFVGVGLSLGLTGLAVPFIDFVLIINWFKVFVILLALTFASSFISIIWGAVD